MLKDRILQPGRYVVCIDPTWHESASLHENFKNVMIDLYCPLAVNMQLLSEQKGIEILSNSLKHVAREIVPSDQRKNHLESNSDYGRNVYRVCDITACKSWFGFIYTNNQSSHELKESITPTLTGLELYGRPDHNIRVPAGSDDIVIWRRTQGSCNFKINSQLIPRDISDAEFISLAKEGTEKEIINGVTYRMAVKTSGVCIYVQNVTS